MPTMPLKQVLAGDQRKTEAKEAGRDRPNLEHIEDALLALNEKERLVLALRYYEKLSEGDVAAALRMQISDVKKIYRKAIDDVVKYLSGRSKR